MADEPVMANRRDRPSALRLILATIASGAGGSLLLAFVFVALKIVSDGGGIRDFLVGMMLYGTIALAFALPAAGLLGLPLYLLLHRLGKLRRRSMLIGGGVIASVPFVVLTVPRTAASPIIGEDPFGVVMLSAILFIAGVFAAALFWKLAGLRSQGE